MSKIKENLPDLKYDVEGMLKNVEFAINNYTQLKNDTSNGIENKELSRLVNLTQDVEMCHQILRTIHRISNDNGLKNESELMLTALECLDEMKQLLKSKNIDIDKLTSKTIQVATISQILQ